MTLDCQFFFSTEKYGYINNPFQINFQGSKELFNALKYNDGIMSTNLEEFFDVFKIYIKWYNISNAHEYSSKDAFELLEFKYSVEHKESYTNEPSFCIECNVAVRTNDMRLNHISLKFNMLLNDKLEVIGIDPCCSRRILITKCILIFNIKKKKCLLFYNEI